MLGHQGDVGGARNTLVFAIQTGTEGRPGPQVKARRTRAARFPPTSSGASGAKPHPDASCPSRPTTTSKLVPKPPKQGDTGHTKDAGGACQEGSGGRPSSRGPAPRFRQCRPSSGRPDRTDQVAPPESAAMTSVKARADRDARGRCGAVRPRSFAGPNLEERGCRGQDWPPLGAPRCRNVSRPLPQHHRPTAPP